MWQLVFLALFQAAASPPQSTEPATQAAATPEAVDEGPPIVVEGEIHQTEGRIVCTIEAPTGTMLRRRVCRTQALLDAERDSLRRARMRPNMPARGANGGFLPN